MSAFGKLRVAIVADEITLAALSPEVELIELSPWMSWWQLKRFRPDFVLIESAWRANGGKWRFRIARYEGHRFRSNRALRRLVAYARDLHIPVVFWNKEDPIHFDRFIDSAALCDYVFTVDENSIDRYERKLGWKGQRRVHVLPFMVQPRIHHPGDQEEDNRLRRANFVGSWHSQRHEQRRRLLYMLLERCGKHFHIDVFDRNYYHPWEAFRYPAELDIHVCPAVPYERTAEIFRRYLVSLNVNTVLNSPTMFSRRLIEIMACRGLAVTTPSVAVEKNFSGLCHIVHDDEQADELFSRLSRDGLSRQDREMMYAAAEYVLSHYRADQFIKRIVNIIER